MKFQQSSSSSVHPSGVSISAGKSQYLPCLPHWHINIDKGYIRCGAEERPTYHQLPRKKVITGYYFGFWRSYNAPDNVFCGRNERMDWFVSGIQFRVSQSQRCCSKLWYCVEAATFIMAESLMTRTLSLMSYSRQIITSVIDCPQANGLVFNGRNYYWDVVERAYTGTLKQLQSVFESINKMDWWLFDEAIAA